MAYFPTSIMPMYNGNIPVNQVLSELINYVKFPIVHIDGDKIPYNFRPTNNGTRNIGDRETDMLVGGTVAFNQLVQTTDTSTTVTSGHKYLSKINNVQTVAISDGTAISINDGTEDNVHDLTQMFGSTIADYIHSLEQGTAGAGVAWFRNLFPKSYYAYNAGTLMSVQTSKHITTGFNQWDEEWELGYYNVTDGSFISRNNGICSKRDKPIKVLPNTVYAISVPYASTLANAILFYDADDNYISWVRVETSANILYGVFTTPANARYARFYLNQAYGTTYNHDICINLSWDGERNGEYEPYVKHEYALDSDLELRGIPKLDSNNKLYYDGDTYESDGTVTRKYGYRAYESGDESLSDTITDGTHTVYKLTTPTTETADTFQNPQIVDDFGTEEYVDNREVAIPVGHETIYQTPISV